MRLTSDKKRELRLLIVLALEGDITSSQSEYLGSLLAGDPAALEYYFELLEVSKALKDTPWLSHAKHHAHEDTDVFDARMWQALAELEKTAPPVPAAPKEAELQALSPSKPASKSSIHNILWPRVLGLAAVICIGLFIAAIMSPPPNKPVCQVKTLVNEDWASKDQTVKIGDWIRSQDKPRQLLSGVAKLVFENKAEVLIEAPAIFSVKDLNSLILERGRAYAIVPESAHGFMIQTPCSEIVDLGTEFGVQVGQNGASNVQVYVGKTTLKAKDAPDSDTIDLTEGEAKQVNSLTYRISNSPFHDQAFVRYLALDGSFVWRGAPFDLADVVGYGNGFGSGRLDTGISMVTGHSGAFSGFGPVRMNSSFLVAPDNQFVDGVFSPAAEIQTISSTGLTFKNPRETTGFSWGGVILNGAKHEDQTSVLRRSHQYRLASMMFGTPDRPAISMHSNAGITFDLQAIQSSVQGVSVDKFKAWCGISESYFDYQSNLNKEDQSQNEPCADFFVLLDGKIVYQALNVTPSQGAMDLDIALTSNNKYLTLVVTEGQDNQIMGDWALFAAPRITLKRQ